MATKDIRAIFSQRRNRQAASVETRKPEHGDADAIEMADLSPSISQIGNDDDSNQPSATKVHGLKRQLKERHMTMIALGGTIGTGLFISAGTSLASAGPGGALVSYLLMGIIVFFLMSS
ncbi:hypothetical protein FBU59_003833, partial [Linderina macrospora]